MCHPVSRIGNTKDGFNIVSVRLPAAIVLSNCAEPVSLFAACGMDNDVVTLTYLHIHRY